MSKSNINKYFINNKLYICKVCKVFNNNIDNFYICNHCNKKICKNCFLDYTTICNICFYIICLHCNKCNKI